MAGKKTSKNNPDGRNISKGKFVVSSDCEVCTQKCERGLNYLKKFAIKKEGNGVMCFKK